jgi:hypothetical protein
LAHGHISLQIYTSLRWGVKQGCYKLRNNFLSSSKVEYLLEHLDGVLENILLVVVEDIHKKFTPRNMSSMFIEPSMTHKALYCLKHIDNHGLFKRVSVMSICEEVQIWSNEDEKLSMG